MNWFPLIFRLGFLSVLATSPAFADLPTRSELLQQRYEEDRAKGVAVLNQRYIATFEEEFAIAMKANKLEEANFIRGRIDALKAEIEQLTKTVSKDKKVEPKEKAENPLEGMTLSFPHNGDPSKTAYYSFHKNGEAKWLGTGNQSVERQYKATGEPNEYMLWWPGRESQGNVMITVSEDGKSAAIHEMFSGRKIRGDLTRTP